MATLPIVAQETLLAAFFLTRRRSRATSDRLFDWLVAPVGTFLPFALRPTAVAGTWLPAGEWLQVAGATMAVAGLLSLGRSIGIVATNRGVKTAGMYRVVRHPMYVAYMLTYCGYILSFPSWRNGIIVITTVAALVARAIVEERLLANDPTYSDYTRQVRWRFVPLVY
jgi:protein-S-isoprenylcysteine O-methyltransferase Ste14